MLPTGRQCYQPPTNHAAETGQEKSHHRASGDSPDDTHGTHFILVVGHHAHGLPRSQAPFHTCTYLSSPPDSKMGWQGTLEDPPAAETAQHLVALALEVGDAATRHGIPPSNRASVGGRDRISQTILRQVNTAANHGPHSTTLVSVEGKECNRRLLVMSQIYMHSSRPVPSRPPVTTKWSPR